MEKIYFSQNLNYLMQENNLSQVALAKKIEVTQSTISAWLSRKKEPRLINLVSLAHFFNISIDELIK